MAPGYDGDEIVVVRDEMRGNEDEGMKGEYNGCSLVGSR